MIEARAVTNAFRFWIVVPMVLLVLAAGAASADPVEYDFVYVDAFQSQYDLRECYLFDVNNHGQACGWATDLDSGRIPNYSAFQWSAGNDKTKIPFLYARAINIAGKIAGWNHVFDPTSGSLVTIPQVPGRPLSRWRWTSTIRTSSSVTPRPVYAATAIGRSRFRSSGTRWEGHDRYRCQARRSS